MVLCIVESTLGGCLRKWDHLSLLVSWKFYFVKHASQLRHASCRACVWLSSRNELNGPSEGVPPRCLDVRIDHEFPLTREKIPTRLFDFASISCAPCPRD